MQTAHEKPQSFTCPTCQKVYNRKDSLTAHLKIHAGTQKKYKCGKCDKTFSRSNHLKKHQKTHEKFDLENAYIKVSGVLWFGN